MPKIVEIQEWCDPCYKQDGTLEAAVATDVITLNRKQPREALFCERHRKEYLGGLEELLEGLPTVEAPRPAPGRGPARKKSSSAATSAPKEEDRQTSTGPVVMGTDDDYVCPECQQVFAHRLGNNRPAQALGVHMARSHGIKGSGKGGSKGGKTPKTS